MNNEDTTVPTNNTTNAYFSKKKKSNPLKTFMTESNTKKYNSTTKFRPKSKTEFTTNIKKQLFQSQISNNFKKKVNKELFEYKKPKNFEIKLVESDIIENSNNFPMTTSIDFQNFIKNKYNKNEKNIRFSNNEINKNEKNKRNLRFSKNEIEVNNIKRRYLNINENDNNIRFSRFSNNTLYSTNTINSSLTNYSRDKLIDHCQNLEKINKKLKNENSYFKEIIEIFQNGIHKKTKLNLVNLKKEYKLLKKKFNHLEKNFTKYLFDLKLKLENKNRKNLENSKRDLCISFATDQNFSIKTLKKEIKKLKLENSKFKSNPKKMLKKKYKEILEEKDNEISFLKKIVSIRQNL